MDVYTLHTYGDDSDEVTVCVDKILLNNVANPLVPTKAPVDWSVWYTNDGDPLDGSPSEAYPAGRPALLYYQWYGNTPKVYLQVFIGGAPTLAKGIPFRYVAASHGAAILTFNVPHTPDTLTECSEVFQQADGTQLGVDRFQMAIQ